MKNLVDDFARNHPRLWEIIKFLIVGGFATIIDMLVMALVIFLLNQEVFSYNFFNVLTQSNAQKNQIQNFSSILGTGSGFLAGTIFNYIMSVKYVFSQKEYAQTLNGAVLFVILSALGLSIHLIGMWAFFEVLKINFWAVKITITIFVLVFNYTTRKFFVFKVPTPKKSKIYNQEFKD